MTDTLQTEETTSKIASDPRIDPRIKAVMGLIPSMSQSDVSSREELLAEANSDAGIAQRDVMRCSWTRPTAKRSRRPPDSW